MFCRVLFPMFSYFFMLKACVWARFTSCVCKSAIFGVANFLGLPASETTVSATVYLNFPSKLQKRSSDLILVLGIFLTSVFVDFGFWWRACARNPSFGIHLSQFFFTLDTTALRETSRTVLATSCLIIFLTRVFLVLGFLSCAYERNPKIQQQSNQAGEQF